MSRSDRRQRGGAALEFALVLPVLLGFVLAGLDLSSLISQAQRTAAAAAAAADLATQIERFSPETDVSEIVTGRELGVLALAASQAAYPHPLLENGAIIVTSVGNGGYGPAVVWQQRWGQSGLGGQFGSGDYAGLTIQSGEGAIFAEAISIVRPWRFSAFLLGLPDEVIIRRLAVRRPRLAAPVVE